MKTEKGGPGQVPLKDGTRIGGGGHHVLNITSDSPRGPESFTSAMLSNFVDAIPISVHVSAGGS